MHTYTHTHTHVHTVVYGKHVKQACTYMYQTSERGGKKKGERATHLVALHTHAPINPMIEFVHVRR